MKINTSDLKSALDIVRPALSVKGIIEQTDSFAFIEGSVVTYNDEICITHELKGIKLDGVIKAEELYKFLTKVKEKEFDITITDSEVQMKAGRSKVGFALNREVLLPINDEELTERGDWEDLPKNFLSACKFVAASASTDMSDPKLTCVHITSDGVLEASNNYRLVVWSLEEDINIPTTLIPASSLKEVIRIQPSQIASGNGWVHFKSEATTISCRTFDETFVNTDAIMKSIGKLKKIKFPDGLLPILEKAEIFSQEQKTDSSVTLEFKNGKITVMAESTTAWFKETIACDVEDEFMFTITPYLLKDILKQKNECGINKSMLKFTGDQWVYISTLKTFK